MLNLNETFHAPGLFVLYTAPVAGGKTHSIKEYYRHNACKIVFISPFRALAEETYESLAQNQKNVYILRDSPFGTFKQFHAKETGLLVATMELLDDSMIEALAPSTLIVLDEFHLLYFWGFDFRPILRERWLGLLQAELPLLALTATFDEHLFHLLEEDLHFHSEHYVHIDHGNFEWRYRPAKLHYHSSPVSVSRAFYRTLRKKKKNEVFLVFVGQRRLVDEWHRHLSLQGYSVLGCVGGEVKRFIQELKESDHLDVILTTSALSHGVNLPEIAEVFIAYEVKNEAFWIQMIGRGGRQGSPYSAHTCDLFEAPSWLKWWHYLLKFLWP